MMDIAELYNEAKAPVIKDRPKPRVGAASVMGCQRKLALRLKGERAPDTKGSPWLEEGKLHEKEIIERIQGLGIRVTETGEKDGWFDTIIGGVPVKGQRDGILPEIPAVLEIKSMNHEQKLRSLLTPYDKWRVQGEVYMRVTNLPMTLLFAKARDTGWARQWVFKKNDKLWAKIQENLSIVKKIKDPWSHDVEIVRDCQWCAWREKCWPGRFAGTIDISEW